MNQKELDFYDKLADQKEFYKKQLEETGDWVQIFHFYEEVGELMTGLSHLIRGRCKAEDIAEEIVDCFLMLSEMKTVVEDKAMEEIDWMAILNKKLEKWKNANT